MKSDLEHTSTMLGSQNMKSSQRMVSVVEPYELPEGWKWCRLGDVGETLTGSTPSKKKTEYYGGEFPFFKPADLEQGINLFQSSEYLSAEGKKVSRIVPAKSTLICCIGSIGKSGYSLREGTTNQQINAIIPHKYIDSKYVFYAVNTEDFINQLWSKASSTTISIVNKSKMDNCIIPLPPTLAEQQRIVNRIESMFAKLDEAKEKAQNVVDGFETRKAAILHKAFTGELTAKWRKENGVSDDSWEEKTIGECLIAISDKYDPQKDKIDGVQYIGLENIEANGGIISTGDVLSVKSIKTLFKNNDLLYGKLRPYLNKHDIVEFDGICSTDILVYRSKPEYEIKFFNYLFSQNCFIQYAIENSNGINLPRTSEKNISAYSQKIPTLPEQVEIVRILDIIIEKENKAKQAAEAVLEQRDLLKKSILARAFRGEL